mmetsp:Transcript_38560/g.85840  ORF Transcript_38560/g.85840 Transcript_38560/m.85840 type:complete len:97 (+) Transcript_38560:99-389(+)|eukprot:CAMPEP_0202898612 /NCGR_PEP_ID=MMETSP1392-20130828/7091_1 /ASSEMBLY_ACC=CAM_ASM_000868 /TAXON_ID=225041 /ORGANISM="Chlamydomonas chlamydogama, Strain SAG 11-48b" /LENGTH=96 /DNA_ID=CAMNT_0049584595 /DNA_START=145 /DNA_END=435 /DNA_ORIENTATION=+
MQSLRATQAVASSRAICRRQVVVRASSSGQINPSIKKNEEKVADFVKVADLPKKAVYCRCWRTQKWPHCDGSHVAHNKATGDNVGPLVIENPDAQK